MKILAVDTATEICSAGLIQGGEPRAEITLKLAASHSRHLVSAIDQLLKGAGWRLEELNALAVTCGPGSFTGLRIGISALKGLALALDKPLVGVSTLEALAFQCRGTSRVIRPMLDGRRGQVFTNHYRFSGGRLKSLGQERALSPQEAVAEIGEPTLLVGNGAQLYRELLEAGLPGYIQLGSDIQHRIHGISVAQVAHDTLRGRKGAAHFDPGRLGPVYIRKPDAKLPKISEIY
ncbi:MAG: tRNA (adenosine(37)-N6)-threonylcarbamoyltransferase complex dimerization subunit type 1 TsaB [Desulfobacterales bacterium]